MPMNFIYFGKEPGRMKTAVKSFILIFLSLVVFAACGAHEEELFDEDFALKGDKTDLEGATIKYVRESGGLAFNVGDEEVLGFEMNTVLGDLALQRIKDVQNNFNCKLDIVYFSGDAQYTNYRLSNAAGSYYCDIFCGISDRFREYMKAGTIVGLSQLDGLIDYRNEEKWGTRNVLEVLYWEDDVYGLIPLAWPTSSVSYTGLTIVNEDLIASLNTEDPRDLYENGKWTWETFRDCLEKYYAQEGSEVKHYALASVPFDFGANYLLSNGYRLAEKGPDGNYRSGVNNPAALAAMNEALDVFNGPLSYTIDRRNIILAPVEDLIAGQTVMGVMHYAEYVADRIVKSMTNFGVLPWPSGPAVEPGFISSFHMNLERAVVISSLSNNLEATAIALNALYEPFEEYPDIESIKDFLHHTYFFDRRDADIYYDMFQCAQYSYFSTAPFQTLGEWVANGQTPTEYIESRIDKIEEYIAQEIAPSKRGIDNVWKDE